MAPGHGPDLVQAVGVKGREGQLARAVHTDARHRCVQPSADTVVAGAVDGTQQRLEPRVGGRASIPSVATLRGSPAGAGRGLCPL